MLWGEEMFSGEGRKQCRRASQGKPCVESSQCLWATPGGTGEEMWGLHKFSAANLLPLSQSALFIFIYTTAEGPHSFIAKTFAPEPQRSHRCVPQLCLQHLFLCGWSPCSIPHFICKMKMISSKAFVCRLVLQEIILERLNTQRQTLLVVSFEILMKRYNFMYRHKAGSLQF